MIARKRSAGFSLLQRQADPATAAQSIAVPPQRSLRRRSPVAQQRQRRSLISSPGLSRTRASVAIIDYGSGNLHSAAKAFERAARDFRLSL
jgi:hypothetical protein